MNDPRLNSVHLELPRREHYRDARARLLDARGTRTLFVEEAHLGPDQSPGPVLGAGRDPRCVLIDVDDGRRYSLHIGLNALGRFPENDIVLKDGAVSRRHCVLLLHASGGCELHDTASKNGTIVNRHRVDRAWLKPGDVLQVCSQCFVFAWEQDRDGPPEKGARDTMGNPHRTPTAGSVS